MSGRGRGHNVPNETLVFRPTEEYLLACRTVTAAEKLRWLKEANIFLREVAPPERLERWARLYERGQLRPDRPGLPQ